MWSGWRWREWRPEEEVEEGGERLTPGARHKAALQPVSELRSAQCSRHNGALLVQPFDTLKTRKVSLWGDMAKR